MQGGPASLCLAGPIPLALNSLGLTQTVQQALANLPQVFADHHSGLPTIIQPVPKANK